MEVGLIPTWLGMWITLGSRLIPQTKLKVTVEFVNRDKGPLNLILLVSLKYIVTEIAS